MRFLAVIGIGIALLGCGCGPPPAEAIGPRTTPFLDYLRQPGTSMVAYAPAGEIDRELKLLRQKFDGLALYGFDDHTSDVLATAAKLHYRAILATIWDPRSNREITQAATLLPRYANSMAIAVSIGSEGLLENRYHFDDLGAAAAEFDRQSPIRFERTTSEPWWRYLDGQPDAAALRSFGDFVTVHVHVVWDADITDPAEAARWSRDRAVQIMNLSGSPVLVREAGFPGDGTSPRASREGFTFTRDAQAKFWREWVALRQRQSTGGHAFVSLAVAFEAIDNPTKEWRNFEGSWGLLAPGTLEPWPAWSEFPDVR